MPNVVIDGSPNENTVLTLTHWPGYPQPSGFHFDLSAEMAFQYLDDSDRPIRRPTSSPTITTTRTGWSGSMRWSSQSKRCAIANC